MVAGIKLAIAVTMIAGLALATEANAQPAASAVVQQVELTGKAAHAGGDHKGKHHKKIAKHKHHKAKRHGKAAKK